MKKQTINAKIVGRNTGADMNFNSTRSYTSSEYNQNINNHTNNYNKKKEVNNIKPVNNATPVNDTKPIIDVTPVNDTKPIIDLVPINDTKPIDVTPVSDVKPIIDTEPISDAKPTNDNEVVHPITNPPVDPRSLIIRNFNSDDPKYDDLDKDFRDSINSKMIINTINDANILNSDNPTVTRGVVMLEIKRLLLRSLKTSSSNIEYTILDDKVVVDSLKVIEFCVDGVISTRNDDLKYYRNNIILSLMVLFDIFEVNMESDEANKLTAFIRYFIDVFTNTKTTK